MGNINILLFFDAPIVEGHSGGLAAYSGWSSLFVWISLDLLEFSWFWLGLGGLVGFGWILLVWLDFVGLVGYPLVCH